VASLWQSEENVVLLTGSRASEAAFKEAAPGKRILHLATHAYFLDPECFADSGGVDNSYNPLLLSGFALAGANKRSDAALDAEDGILTAQEIASLDLSATHWAVLSACGTGTGAIQSGEGVLGLQRAFRIAGARTLITSLWAVEDNAAQQWMIALYDTKPDAITAVRHASLTILDERRANNQDTHPFYWAAFVASGDWR